MGLSANPLMNTYSFMAHNGLYMSQTADAAASILANTTGLRRPAQPRAPTNLFVAVEDTKISDTTPGIHTLFTLNDTGGQITPGPRVSIN